MNRLILTLSLTAVACGDLEADIGSVDPTEVGTVAQADEDTTSGSTLAPTDLSQTQQGLEDGARPPEEGGAQAPVEGVEIPPLEVDPDGTDADEETGEEVAGSEDPAADRLARCPQSDNPLMAQGPHVSIAAACQLWAANGPTDYAIDRVESRYGDQDAEHVRVFVVGDQVVRADEVTPGDPEATTEAPDPGGYYDMIDSWLWMAEVAEMAGDRLVIDWVHSTGELKEYRLFADDGHQELVLQVKNWVVTHDQNLDQPQDLGEPEDSAAEAGSEE